MMDFTRYEKYKDSGVEWLGEIPEGWGFKRAKDISAINPTTRSSQKFADDNKIDFLPMTNVDEVKGKIKAFNQEAYGEIKNGYTKFKNNDILFAKITPCMENGNCVIVENLKYNLGFGSTEFIVFRTNRRVDRKYFHYFLRNNSFRTRAEQFMIGTAGQKRISTFFLTVHEISFPPLQTQTAIVEYLDEKTAQIDKKIELLQAKKEKYQELRKTLVNEAVTKGIDKTVELKDSGVEWLGKIPKHWEVKRIKEWIKSVVGGGTPSTSKKEYWNGNIPWVSPKDMKTAFISRTEDYISELAVIESATNLISPGKVLIVARSGILQHTLPVAVNKVEVALNQDIKAFESHKTILPLFLFWQLKGRSNQILSYCSKVGATVESIEMG